MDEKVNKTKPIPDFDMDDKKFANMIDSYKKGVEDGVICSPCPESFAAYCATTMQAFVELLERGKEQRSVYYKRAKLYKLMLQWFRAEIAGGQHWPARSDYMRKFLLLQDWGDGFIYIEKQDPKKKSGKKPYQINFGGNDKRSKAAWE